VFRVPEKYRLKAAEIYSAGQTCEGLSVGCFKIPRPFSHRRKSDSGNFLLCIASNGFGATEAGLSKWEHVSVSIFRRKMCPSWEDMCLAKSIFWEPEDCVVQFHPPESDYVNQHPYTLHLWRPVELALPRPESIMVGQKL